MAWSELPIWHHAGTAELVGHLWLECVEILAVATLYLVADAAPTTACLVLKLHGYVSVEVNTSEIRTALDALLRFTYVKDCRVCKNCDWT